MLCNSDGKVGAYYKAVNYMETVLPQYEDYEIVVIEEVDDDEKLRPPEEKME